MTFRRIDGDELEHDRILLENNLQHTDLSLRLSSQDDLSSVDTEYARHNPGPDMDMGVGSYIRRPEEYDDDYHPGWSYRTGEDTDMMGVSPYGGQTMSTAAHHASALTLSAGLGGARAARRDGSVSLSAAEYDPDRRLEELLDEAGSKYSLFDNDPSRSRYPVSRSPSCPKNAR
jgi:hypothetical protein